MRLKLTLCAVVVMGVSAPAWAADNACAKLTGADRAACAKDQGKAKGRDGEMRGVGAKGKGKGAEMGDGLSKGDTGKGKPAK